MKQKSDTNTAVFDRQKLIHGVNVRFIFAEEANEPLGALILELLKKSYRRCHKN